MSDLAEPPPLNPAQQEVQDSLGAKPHERPTFRDDLGQHLRHEMEEAIGPMLSDDLDGPLFVSKRDLATLHNCQARYLAEKEEEFAWTVPTARGTVAHKAIELLVSWQGDPNPLDLVDAAMARIEAEEWGAGPFLSSLDPAERAELTGRANDFVAAFLDTFPPLNRRWRPVAEARVRAEICEDMVTLNGRVDLSLGRTEGNVAGKVLIDLKTGRSNPIHVEDLRFYALLETLRCGVPPRLLVDYYLESGEPRSEVVTEELLWSTAKRVVDGVGKLAALLAPDAGPAPTQPSRNCKWCCAVSRCDAGKHYTEGHEPDSWQWE